MKRYITCASASWFVDAGSTFLEGVEPITKTKFRYKGHIIQLKNESGGWIGIYIDGEYEDSVKPDSDWWERALDDVFHAIDEYV